MITSSTSAKEEKVYFYNLNGLRAIGAFIVLIGHIEFLKKTWRLPVKYWFPIPGKIGVTLFFALSGFLITSLLLQELSITKTVSLKKFYARRILRIWPLYYFIIAMGIFVFNQTGFLKLPASDAVMQNLNWLNVLILIFIMPNFTQYSIPYADQRWSIVVEEQFYLVQPLLIKLFKYRNRILWVFILIVFSPEILRAVLFVTGLNHKLSDNIISALLFQLIYLACIAIGCIFSVLYFKKEPASKKIIFSKPVQILSILIISVFICLGKYFYKSEELIDYRIYSFLFAIVVCNASQNLNTIFKLETPLLNFLGKISYGLYMYHPVCIGVSIALAKFLTTDKVLMNIIIYTFSVALSIFVSWLSYKYFESFFLKLKTNFETSKARKKLNMQQSDINNENRTRIAS